MLLEDWERTYRAVEIGRHLSELYLSLLSIEEIDAKNSREIIREVNVGCDVVGLMCRRLKDSGSDLSQ